MSNAEIKLTPPSEIATDPATVTFSTKLLKTVFRIDANCYLLSPPCVVPVFHRKRAA